MRMAHRRAGPLSLTETAQCGHPHKLPLSFWKAIFMIYWDGSYRIYFTVFQVTSVCAFTSSCSSFFLWHCIFLVQYSCTKKEWKCQDLAQIVLTWPLEGNSMLSSTSLLFITLPATSLQRRETGSTVHVLSPAEWVCGPTLLCQVRVCSSSTGTFEQVQWRTCSQWSSSQGGVAASSSLRARLQWIMQKREEGWSLDEWKSFVGGSFLLHYWFLLKGINIEQTATEVLPALPPTPSLKG